MVLLPDFAVDGIDASSFAYSQRSQLERDVRQIVVGQQQDALPLFVTSGHSCESDGEGVCNLVVFFCCYFHTDGFLSGRNRCCRRKLETLRLLTGQPYLLSLSGGFRPGNGQRA